ncbi:MAG: tRNA (guanosine(46)-N7)-methyltransferase TrmB [Alphaproteobacteria bacterium]|nr:tRNA (guanosine(46)-N7)-methyltransferase TrmB [Alphaproteobacteria bacterium]
MSRESVPAYRFYGRRKGYRLRPSQKCLIDQFLPRFRITPSSFTEDLRDLFSFSPEEIWLEIGFGSAEHLLSQARLNPLCGLIGVEPFINGMVKALSGIEAENLENIRIYDGDVRDLLPLFPSGSLTRIFTLFPDPWPKARHQKRRLFSSEMIDECARLLAPGGELRIASDISDYIDWILRRIYRHPSFRWQACCARDWRVRPDDWPVVTRYEAKAACLGRPSSYLCFLREPVVPFCL